MLQKKASLTLNPSAGDLTITHGPVSGEVTAESAVLWARGNAAGQLAFTIAPVTDPDFEEDLITAETDIDETTEAHCSTLGILLWGKTAV